MGFGSVYTLASEIRAGRTDVRKAVAWLIQRNHAPAGPAALVDPAIAAMRAVSLGLDTEKIPLPPGVTYKGAQAVAADRLVDEFHLRPLIGLEQNNSTEPPTMSTQTPTYESTNVLGSPYVFRLHLDRTTATALQAKLEENTLPFALATRLPTWDIYRHGGSSRSGLRVAFHAQGGAMVECTDRSVCSILEAAGFGSMPKPGRAGTSVPATSGETSELAIYIDNNAKLWAEIERVFVALERKLERGTYNAGVAASMLRHLVDQGAREYVQEYSGHGTKVDQVFSPEQRAQVAADLARYLEGEYKAGNRYTKQVPPKTPKTEPAKGTAKKKDAKSKNESFDDDDGEPAPDCPICGGPGGLLGSLGRRTHYTCRNCGMQYSNDKGGDEPAPARMPVTKAVKPKAAASDGVRRIRVTFTKVAPNGDEKHGWLDEEGQGFDHWVDAASYLRKRLTTFSDTRPSGRSLEYGWYSDEGTQDFRTGEWTQHGYHLSGFPEHELEAIYDAVITSPSKPLPDPDEQTEQPPREHPGQQRLWGEAQSPHERENRDTQGGFHAAYRRWLDAALEEFNSEYGEGSTVGERKYHQHSVPEDYNPDDLVEFSEDGDAYPHSEGGGTGHIRRAVTPWAKSEHYTESKIVKEASEPDRPNLRYNRDNYGPEVRGVMAKAEQYLEPREMEALKGALRFADFYEDLGTAFDIASGLYWYASDWYDGQWHPLYALMGALQYRPGLSENGPEEGLAQDVYDALSATHGEPTEGGRG